MKIEQEVPDLFQPVTLTLESMEEVLCLFTAVNARIDVLSPEEQSETEFLLAIADFLEEVK